MLCTPGTSISHFSSVLVLLSWCLLLNLANRSSPIGVCVTQFATWSPICTSVVSTEIHIPITSQGCNRLFYFYLFSGRKRLNAQSRSHIHLVQSHRVCKRHIAPHKRHYLCSKLTPVTTIGAHQMSHLVHQHPRRDL